MKKKLLDLLAKKRGIVDRMRQADAAGDQTAFDAALAENTAVDAEIARVKAIMEAEENVPAEPEGVPTSGTDPPAAEPVNSRECVHAFAECIRAQARGQRVAFETNADVLRRAMAAENAGAMTEGVEADGGLLVPQDIQTRINELRRSLVPLPDTFPFQYNLWKNGKNLLQQCIVPAHFSPVPEPAGFLVVPYWNQNSHHRKTLEKVTPPVRPAD